MKNGLVLLMIVVLFVSESSEKQKQKTFTRVEIKTLVQDSILNVRALEVSEDRVSAMSSNGERYSIFHSNNDSIIKYMTRDSMNSRSCAFQNNSFFHLSIASPAKLFKDDRLVYQEHHSKTFYDALDFWNDLEGIAIGDPTNDCMSIIITRDAGETWTKLPCDVLPKSMPGEAAFAASDTNIDIVGDHTWVATGGKASRILYSPDKGVSWSVFDTPIIQGLETTGIFSIDFYDEQNGFAIGGDYTKPEINKANKIRTTNGGKTWHVVSENKNPGYRSCVQFIPGDSSKSLVAVGFSGIDYSKDFGETWKHLSDEGFYTIRLLNDSVAYAAGQNRISKLYFK